MTRINLIAFAGAMLVSVAGYGQTTTTRNINLPGFGLAATETARVSLTNLAANATNGTAAACNGSVQFVNAAGANIGTASTFSIAAGVTTSVSLPFGSSGATGTRAQIRPVVAVTRVSNAQTPCSLSIVVESFDTSSGVTHVYHAEGDAVGGFGR